MQAQLARKLFFNDGYVFSRERIFIACQFCDYAGSDISRPALIIDGNWTYEDIEDSVLSVTCIRRNRQVFFLGRNGNVLVVGGGRKSIEVVPDSTKFGDLLRVRSIADQVYACGMTGQIYVRDANGWRHIDEGTLGMRGLDFEDIDGFGPDDLYVVGMHGAIYHYDGKIWSQIDSPTNRPLSNVRCVTDGEILICGDNGSLFGGNANRLLNLTEGERDLNFYGLEVFQGKIYMAHPGGIIVHDRGNVSEVDFGHDWKIGCHRLHAADGVLWSFGIDDLAYFDGATWTRVTCPMND